MTKERLEYENTIILLENTVISINDNKHECKGFILWCFVNIFSFDHAQKRFTIFYLPMDVKSLNEKTFKFVEF